MHSFAVTPQHEAVLAKVKGHGIPAGERRDGSSLTFRCTCGGSSLTTKLECHCPTHHTCPITPAPQEELAIKFQDFKFSGSVRLADDCLAGLPLCFTCSPAPNRTDSGHGHSLHTTLHPRKERLSCSLCRHPLQICGSLEASFYFLSNLQLPQARWKTKAPLPTFTDHLL